MTVIHDEGVDMEMYGQEMPLNEDNDSPERIVSNAILEANSAGIVVDMGGCWTPEQVAVRILETFEEYGADDLHTYWRSNFIIFDLVGS